MTFYCRFFIFFVFDKISKGHNRERAGGIFSTITFLKMPCRVCYLFDFDHKIRSGQVWIKSAPKSDQNKKMSWPLDSSSLKPGIQSLYERVFWKDGARCHPVRGPIRGYSFSEIIAGNGGDGLYYHDKFRLGKFLTENPILYFSFRSLSYFLRWLNLRGYFHFYAIIKSLAIVFFPLG